MYLGNRTIPEGMERQVVCKSSHTTSLFTLQDITGYLTVTPTDLSPANWPVLNSIYHGLLYRRVSTRQLTSAESS